jgi:diguanylate cyclase (GGDEF)-like protein
MHAHELDFNVRDTFFGALEEQIRRCARSHTALGLLIVDLRNFRRINAVHGFQIGNEILQLAQNRIKACLRTQDVIARVGDDRFGIILPELPHGEVVRLAAGKVLKTIKEPFLMEHGPVKLDASIGVAVHTVYGMSAEKFVLEAEKSLKFAKQRNLPYAIIETEASEVHDKEWELEEALHHALDRDELRMYYQPVIDLKTRMPCHAEALMRWTHNTLGAVSPSVFIPLAERAGMMDSLTKWGLGTVLRDMAGWPASAKGSPRAALNLSATTLHDQDLVDMVYTSLRIWGAEPTSLTLEITETALMQDPKTSRQHLKVLQDSGLHISIDDFGTGYSSLDYFRNVPANELKVDRSFIANMFDNRADEKIVRLVIDLASSFDLGVVAEGVENEKTLKSLIAMGCHKAQGFYFARPMPQKEYIDWLDGYNPQQFFRD